MFKIYTVQVFTATFLNCTWSETSGLVCELSKIYEGNMEHFKDTKFKIWLFLHIFFCFWWKDTYLKREIYTIKR